MNKSHFFRKGYLLILIIVVFLIFHLQANFNFFKETSLSGVVQNVEKDTLTLGSWFDAKYQKNKEINLNASFGFRNTLVRLNNQMNYSIFNKINSTGTKLIVEKNGGLIEESAINSFVGKDRLPDSILVSKFKLVEQIQKRLQEKNVKLVLALMPNKAYFDSLNIPENYLQNVTKNTNYNFIRSNIKHYNINFIDLGEVCVKKIDVSKYPVYPKYGGHWSSYTMYIAMDTIVKTLKKLLGYQDYGFRLLEVKKGYEPICRENDLSLLANLLFEPKENYYLRPLLGDFVGASWSILIGDSYLANIVQEEKYDSIFRKIRFWYYFNSEYGAKITYRGSLATLKSDPNNLLNEVLKCSSIIIVQNDSNTDLGFDFFETMSKAFDHI